MHFSNFFALILLFGTFLSGGRVHSSNIYHEIEVRAYGCGKHPLEVLREGTEHHDLTPEQVLEIVKQDESIRDGVIEILKLYEDCVRLDGMRYRKSQRSELSEAYAAFYKKVSEALQ